MIITTRLKSFQVILFSAVNAKSISKVKVSVARAVVSIVATLVDMRVSIAVQNGHSQVVC